MSTPLIWLVTAIYAVIAADLAHKGEWMGVTFAGYVVGNIGILMSMPR